VTSATNLRSRRALLSAGVSAAAATAAGALSASSPARAGAAYVHLGAINSVAGVTQITNTSTNGNGIWGTGDDAGVYGTGANHGVLGSSNGTGVKGSSGPGTGVYGHSDSSVAVYAEAPDAVALQTVGRIKFATSGIALISAGLSSVTVRPPVGVDVSSSSFVLLTPMANIGTRALWFTKNTTAETIAIHISSSRTSATSVSWLLLG
jgi:hypothetical protein